MSSNKDSKDQARKLRKKMNEEKIVTKSQQNIENTEVSGLPPRGEVHRNKETPKKTKFKIRFPVVRLLAFIFLLIVVLIPSYHYWQDRVEQVETVNTNENENYDIIEFKDKNQEPVVKDEFVVAQEPEVSDEVESDQNLDDQTKSPTSTAGNEQQSEVDVKEVQSGQIAEEPQTNEIPSEDQYIIHIVKPGETLYRVSMKYFKSRSGEPIIKKLNNLNAEGTVYTGQRLKIPANSK